MTAKMTLPMKLMPTIEIRLGKISKAMMRQPGSPSISADFTKSRCRIDSVSERVTRTPQAQEVNAEDDGDDQRAGLADEGREHQQQRQVGDDEDHVGEEGDDLVDHAAP